MSLYDPIFFLWHLTVQVRGHRVNTATDISRVKNTRKGCTDEGDFLVKELSQVCACMPNSANT